MADEIDSIEGEVWKPVVGWDGLYEVSSYGRVRSLDRSIVRKNGSPMTRKGKVLTATVNAGRGGHLSVHLRDGQRDVRREVQVLVCSAFHGPKPQRGMVAAHWDGNPANNMETNVRWATQAENMADAKRHGTLWRGGTLSRPAKKEAVRMAAARDFMNGVSASDVANLHNISLRTAYRIKNSWRSHW